jgi:exosortase C (VPDSG-CTERM-specific)
MDTKPSSPDKPSLLDQRSSSAANEGAARLSPVSSDGGSVVPKKGVVKSLAVLSLIVIVFYARPLFDLTRYAFKSELYSHIVLIPFISLYLIWPKRKTLPVGSPAWGAALLPLAVGIALLGFYWLSARAVRPEGVNYLALMTLSFLLVMLGAALGTLGVQAVRAIAFPIAFLVFMIPFPLEMRNWIETVSQNASSDAAHFLLWIAGMPVLRSGTQFRLPGFSLQVAPECSGIHSTLVLFITSLLAGHLFLHTRWKQVVLALVVIPLAFLRNGFRVAVIGELCVRVGPHMIDSPIHHHGGPVFFALSLIPLFMLLSYLRKSEIKKKESL